MRGWRSQRIRHMWITHRPDSNRCLMRACFFYERAYITSLRWRNKYLHSIIAFFSALFRNECELLECNDRNKDIKLKINSTMHVPHINSSSIRFRAQLRLVSTIITVDGVHFGIGCLVFRFLLWFYKCVHHYSFWRN